MKDRLLGLYMMCLGGVLFLICHTIFFRCSPWVMRVCGPRTGDILTTVPNIIAAIGMFFMSLMVLGGLWVFISGKMPKDSNKTTATAKSEKPIAPIRFSVSEDGVVSDAISNLQWVAGPDLRTTYGGAEEWVQKCRIAGGGWRMPTREELRRLRVQKEGCGNIDPVFKTTGCNIWAEPQGAGGGYGPRAWLLRFANGSETLVATDYFDEGTRAFAVRSLRHTPAKESQTPIQANDITTVVPDLLLFVAEQWKGEKDPSLRLRREDYRRIFEAMARLPIQSGRALPAKAYERPAATAEKIVTNTVYHVTQSMAQGATLKIEHVEPGLLRVQAGGADFRIERTGTNDFRSWWCDGSDNNA